MFMEYMEIYIRLFGMVKKGLTCAACFDIKMELD